jgi:NAD(P)-dependent dehydrogenase (short-subunit alcohol dehydrogenase family)
MKTVLVTGATDGIGKETAQALASQGMRVVITGRNRQKGEAVLQDIKRATNNQNLHLLVADLSNMQEVTALAEAFKAQFDRLDILLNNAGAMFDVRQTTADGLESTFALNHMAYFLLTDLLLPTLKASAPSRIINVASSAHLQGKINWDDIQLTRYSGMAAYYQSKLANVLFTNALARRLEGTGVTANSLHPGVVASKFGENSKLWFVRAIVGLIKRFAITPLQGAQTSIYLATSPQVEGVSGKYFDKKQVAKQNPAATDIAAQEKLWQISEQLLHQP